MLLDLCRRVGDSPIAGAGSYLDQDVGGAAATGDGDIIMRFLCSYQAVENMRNAMSPKKAAEESLKRVLKYDFQICNIINRAKQIDYLNVITWMSVSLFSWMNVLY